MLLQFQPHDCKRHEAISSSAETCMHVIDGESRTLRKGNSQRKTFVTEPFSTSGAGEESWPRWYSLMSGIRLSAESTSFLEYGANRRSSEQRCLLESRRDHFARSRLLFTGLLPIFEGQDWNDTEEEIISLSRPPFLSTRAPGGPRLLSETLVSIVCASHTCIARTMVYCLVHFTTYRG